jgi:RNA polymerase sigma factor for flagellar operon FliA
MANTAMEFQYPEKDPQEREQVILQYLPQVKYIALKIARQVPQSVQLEDLVSAGVVGLLDAYEKFDESRGVQFKTYAEVRIRGEILDSLRNLDWAPRSLRRKAREVEKAYSELEQELHRTPEEEEVAAKLDMEVSDFHTLLDRLNGLSIGYFKEDPESQSGEDPEKSLQYLSSPGEDSPFESFQQTEMSEILAEIIGHLPEREQLLLSLYYKEELTMKEIGLVLGVNESRVSQIHTRIVIRMRSKLQARLKRKK